MSKKLFLGPSLALIICSVLLSCTQATETPTEEPYDGPQFRRWSAVVSDLDETIHLYTKVLGFQLGTVSVDPQTSYVYEVFNIDRGIATRHATFHAGALKRVMSVVEVPGLDPARLPESPRAGVALINANGNFDAIVARLKAGNYETLQPHRLGANGIEVGFLDRDGHMYALYEFPYEGAIKLTP